MNFEKIKSTYIELYHDCLGFIVDPSSAWQKIVDEKRSWPETQIRLIYPMLALICVLGFLRVLIENFYLSDYDFLNGTLFAIAWPVILALFLLISTLGLLFIAYLLSRLSYTFNCFSNLRFLANKSLTFDRMVVFLSHAEIPLFISAAIFAIMPFVFGVLILVNFYAVYVIMIGYNIYFADVMGEERKYHFPTTSVTFIMIYAFTYVAWIVLALI